MDIHRHNVVATRTNALWQMGRITRWATLWRVATRTNALWQIPCRRGLCMCANRRNPHECAVANDSKIIVAEIEREGRNPHECAVANSAGYFVRLSRRSRNPHECAVANIANESSPEFVGVATRTNALWQSLKG